MFRMSYDDYKYSITWGHRTPSKEEGINLSFSGENRAEKLELLLAEVKDYLLECDDERSQELLSKIMLEL